MRRRPSPRWGKRRGAYTTSIRLFSRTKLVTKFVGTVLIWILVAYLFLICAPTCGTWKHGPIGYKGGLSVVAKTGVVEGPFSKLVEIGRTTSKIEDISRVVRHASGFRLQPSDFARKEHIALLSRWPTTILSTGHHFFCIGAISLHGLVRFFCAGYILNATGRNRLQGWGEAEIFNGKIYIPMLRFLSHSWNGVNSNPRTITRDGSFSKGMGVLSAGMNLIQCPSCKSSVKDSGYGGRAREEYDELIVNRYKTPFLGKSAMLLGSVCIVVGCYWILLALCFRGRRLRAPIMASRGARKRLMAEDSFTAHDLCHSR